MKKILHITPHLGGGAGKAISGIVTGLEDCENRIIMLEAPVNTIYSDICTAAGTDVIISADKKIIEQNILSSDIAVLNWWAHPLEVDLLRGVSFGDTPVILWSHINGLNYPYLTYDFLKCFDGLIFTSPCAYENKLWSESERRDIVKSSCITYGTGKFFPEKLPCKKNYSPSDKIKICYSGTLDYSKLNRNFPGIIKQISEKCSCAEFYLYGKYSEKFKHELLEEAGCENVFFCGYTNDIENILTTMDIFCYPLCENNYATTENALLEAMATGLPVVVMDNPAERSIVDNKITGFIAEKTEEFVQISLRLCRDNALRESTGKNARDHVIQKYSYDVNLKSFLTSLENLKRRNSRSDPRLLLGNSIFDAFKFFCGKSDTDEIFDICKGSDIFFSESKSSPFHYLNYFPDDTDFIKLTSQLQSYKNGEEK